MGEMVVHRNALFANEPLVVDCFAYNDKEGILAVARHTDTVDELESEGHTWESEAVIELWNVIGTPSFLLKTLRLGCYTAQSLLWLEESDSLIASHMNGRLTVHHTHTNEHQQFQICVSPIWCLARIKVNAFCAGTDSGAVFLLQLFGDRINTVKAVNIGFGCRVMSLACNGTEVAAGSLDAMHLIDVQGAFIKHTLKLPRDESRKPTVVWSLCFVEGILASGDSRGCVCFWNVGNGALVQTVQTHQADVLSLCAVRDALYAAGVDPSIARLNYNNKDRTNWRVESRRDFHDNDVRALTSSRTALYSGGAQHHFFASTRNKHWTPMKLTPCQVSYSDGGLFMYEYLNRVVVWRAAMAENASGINGRLRMSREPRKMFEIQVPRGDHVIASALSSTGDMLAIAGSTSVFVYSVGETDENEPCVKKMRQLSLSATALLFCGKSLVMATVAFDLAMIQLDTQDEELKIIYFREEAGTVVRLHANPSATAVIALTTRNEVYIVSLRDKQKSRKLKLDMRHAPVMDVQFMNETTLFILFADFERNLLEYSLAGRTPSTKIISRQMLTMAQDEQVMDIHATPKGTAVVGSKGTIRIIQTSEGKRRIAMLAPGPHASCGATATPSRGRDSGATTPASGLSAHAAGGKSTTSTKTAPADAQLMDLGPAATGDAKVEPQTVAEWWSWRLGYRERSVRQQQGAEKESTTTTKTPGSPSKSSGKSDAGSAFEPRSGFFLAAGRRRNTGRLGMLNTGSQILQAGPGSGAAHHFGVQRTWRAPSRDRMTRAGADKTTRADRCVAARLLMFEGQSARMKAAGMGQSKHQQQPGMGLEAQKPQQPILMVCAPREDDAPVTLGAFRRKRFGQN